MSKFTREYYPISKAAALLGREPEYLLHKGAQGSLPIFVMAEHWGGTISDLTNVNGFFYATPGEWVRLSDFAWLFPKTLRRFEDGAAEVTVTHTWNPPNPETGQERHIELDVPVVVKQTQLFVLTKDIENIAVETTSRNVERINKKIPKAKYASATEPPPPDLEIEAPKNAKPVEPVSTTPTAVDTENRYLKIKEVIVLTGLGRQTIYDAMEAGNFPERVRPTGSRAVRWDKSAVIAHMQSGPTNSRPNDAIPKAVPQMKRNQEAQDHEEIKLVSSVPADAENKSKNGLTTHKIAMNFDGIIWNYDNWKTNLASAPKWLKAEGALLLPGKKGKGGDAIWDPVAIAKNILDKNTALKMKLTSVFKNNPDLLPWADAWKVYLSNKSWYES